MKRLTKFIKNILQPDDVADNAAPSANLRVISRDEHNISRSQISDAALKVLYRLHNAGHEALLVGGGVRDTLLGLSPKDFDVSTDATPEQVNQLFRNSRLIGRRFKLVHVVFGREVIEVATFRAPPTEAHSSKEASTGDQGMILRDNVFGNREEDALRRDFTINALYYNIADFSVYSYAGGWDDLQSRQLRLIGDPETRYREDPVRMLRAIRFMGKLDFDLEADTAAPIPMLAPLLEQIPAARLFDELLKLFLAGKALTTLQLLRDHGLFRHMFPATEQCMQEDEVARNIAENTMRNTDTRIQAGKSVTPYFFLAALLWPALVRMQQEFEASGMAPHPALQKAADRVLSQQIRHTAIPKRFSIPMREIWELQLRLPKIQSRKAKELLAHPRFRAAYDFLLLREQSGEDLHGIGDWWTELQKREGVPDTSRHAYRDEPQRKRRRRKPRNT
ncbi:MULTISPECIES: polynucleotide adenylyltransferase PcnB [unclassified Oceanobacter]|uniref:polynucleotide adenylyltransferase PcnB n=1 Tax=unclassified Oceanobacter TaxID=2620260 RepID=UPI0026E15D38|nr:MULTISPECIES: polynucleotide adenylyltransferase PcnB [unclassified Oceanobacter]MDO6683164.1 polynucleotide adenylyltransferase PcnB [Oceanobacter sp. 5_MG-2023]MDP2506525.1 polynucleotide adenylyltransferase PcnB [Oceanobacter sp. 3_MG-2023]MDP2549087.1 polynucleotide adenylyltransferase PcnB [Oceanobacter sp. 4_MG-2023]MDP2609490.1 polynucleotide adenylyltransferase PcnB [Oceanobacter sp. 1_MG-2023]MDP2612810.1 polynucleotide adenylyltransferase PcnB [Oceanobacter sp. 2_MG-2023]